ncbi:MAG: hypothetical protein KF716_34670 [Anaerolineae bacterium]|nr:hypothetical protein [Anaerolineae bacterium]
MRRWMLTCLLVAMTALGSFQTVFANDVLTAKPPIQQMILREAEPVPAGVLQLLQYDGGSGGGGDSMYPLPEGLFWHLPFNSVIPLVDEGKLAIGCGFATEPTATLTQPDHTTIALKSVIRQSAWELGYWSERQGGRTVNAVMCWSYAIPAGYGTQLGTYALTLTGSEGTLRTAWDAQYPKQAMMGYFSGGAYFIGYPANTSFPIWYYQRLSAYPRAGSFVATRTVTTDANGAAVVITTVAAEAGFTLNDLFILTDDPNAPTKGVTYRVVGEREYLNQIHPLDAPLYREIRRA